MNTEMMTIEERDARLERFLEDPESLLWFSVRLALEREFEQYAKERNIENGALNFLSWLSHSKYKTAVGKALLREVLD